MRVIGGHWKGRRIQIPSKNWPVRPTTDFAREALFNILDNRLHYEGISALDLFGGTGIHSIELASRGVKDVTYVDRYKESVKFMKSFSTEWKLPILAVQSDVMTFISKADRQWQYIFADPPYDFQGLEDFVHLILKSGIIANEGIFVLEHISKVKFDHLHDFKEARHYGQTVFSFFAQGS